LAPLPTRRYSAYGERCLAELKALGYQIPTEDDPVRIFPALTVAISAAIMRRLATGSIYLRQSRKAD